VTAHWIEGLASSEALQQLRDELGASPCPALNGLTGPARVLLPLLLLDQPLLVVVARERDVEPTTQDLRTLATEAGIEGGVLPFPAPGPFPFRGLARHADASWRRAAALFAAARGSVCAWVTSPAGLLRPVLPAELLATRVVRLAQGEEMTTEILLEALGEAGYRQEDPVTAPGQICRRGGVLDIFAPDADWPIRLEFFGDTIDSLRSFDPETQRSRGTLERVELPPLADLFVTHSLQTALHAAIEKRFGHQRDGRWLLDRLAHGPMPEDAAEYLPLVPQATVPAWEHLSRGTCVLVEPESVMAEARALHARAERERPTGRHSLALEPTEYLIGVEVLEQRLGQPSTLAVGESGLESPRPGLSCRPAARFAGDLRRLVEDLAPRTGRTVIFLGSAGRAERLREYLEEQGCALGETATVEVRVGALSQGFELPEQDLRILADGDVFPEEVHLHARGRARTLRSTLLDFRDLHIGDRVVHQDHGIARFEGLETIEVAGVRGEYMVLAYQGGDRLKVPIDAFDRVQRYKGADSARPALDRLGSGQWERVKKRVRRAMREMAAELLRLYAERKARPGHAFSSDSPWLKEFEDAFDYEETPDQAAAIDEVGRDMASSAPMDRLVCGDVGYGKTEVAMRAAMRAVVDGKQVALLTPTTILAFQHWKTLRRRFAPFPVAIEMISRLRTPREVRKVLTGLAEGKVDIVVGTHRLLSKDVVFKDLGLLIVDEEQRFGVAAKERLKHLRTTIDCLTLSATPIPRTLQMGLAGLRDMSVIETPPKDRLAIQTSVVKFSKEAIATAIRQELTRGGQVFLVHNRVESIYSLAQLITQLCPEARVVVAHGQMSESELERAMLQFVEGQADVLVATTIVENGLDIPRANTIIINRADRYGLAQLYQLRGRVGRSDRRAQALLLVPPDTVLSELAGKRLAAIRDFSDLGSGFRIAALDLELRGAGNLLGGQQSGHVEAVGLDLYVKLLEQTIRELKGDLWTEGVRAVFNLGVDLRIPADYVPEAEQRMSLYKRLSQLAADEEATAMRAELRDRYGPVPTEVEHLLHYGSSRVRATRLRIIQIDRRAAVLVIRCDPEAKGLPAGLAEAARSRSGATLLAPTALRWPLAANEDPLDALDILLAGLERTAAGTRAP
jgi:transcription-repair coupling factor (superfamily II helicase)